MGRGDMYFMGFPLKCFLFCVEICEVFGVVVAAFERRITKRDLAGAFSAIVKLMKGWVRSQAVAEPVR
jgi:hypothetical protein